jgi:hypothetical protein
MKKLQSSASTETESHSRGENASLEAVQTTNTNLAKDVNQNH